MKLVELYDLPMALQAFLDDNKDLGQNFWEDVNGYSISQSAISRYLKGERKPIKEHHRNIYRKMVNFLEGDYPITEEEFLLEPKDRVRPYLKRIYDYNTLQDNFSYYAVIADHYTLDDWNVVIRYDLADQLYKENKYSDALEHLRDADLYRDIHDEMRADVHFLIGKIKMKNNCWKLALRSFEKAYDLNPCNHYKFHVAQSKQMLLNFSEGDKLLKEIISEDDQELMPSSNIQLAYSYMKRALYDQAIDTLNKVLNKDVPVELRKKAYFQQGQCAYYKRDYSAAAYYYNKSLDLIDFNSNEESIKALISLLRLYTISSDHAAYKKIIKEYESLSSPMDLLDFIRMEMIQSVYLLRYSKNYLSPLNRIKEKLVGECVDQERLTLIFNDLLHEANMLLSGKLKLVMLENLFDLEKDIVNELIR